MYHWLGEPGSRWYPLLAVYYLTYACQFRCPYCSDGAGRPYPTLRTRALDANGALRVLRRIRQNCSSVVLTGGEPLLMPRFGELCDEISSLGFRHVVLTTNGYDLEPLVERVTRNVTELVFSLDTLDEGKADGWYGVGRGALRQILANIDRADRVRPRGCGIVLSCVATPENIDDAYEVQRFARERGFEFAACPQLVGVKAHPLLQSNTSYRRLFDHLIAQKLQGARIYGTVAYLRHMRDLGWFRCRPFTMLVVSPAGDVFYPCLEAGQPVQALSEAASLHEIRRLGERRFGPPPRCGTQCHSACALGFALALGRPWSLIHEGYLVARNHVRRLMPALGPPAPASSSGNSPADSPTRPSRT